MRQARTAQGSVSARGVSSIDYPELAYIHFTESATICTRENDIPESSTHTLAGSSDPFRAIWRPRPFLSASDYNHQKALKASEGKGDLIVFVKYFIQNVRMPKSFRFLGS